MKPSQRILITLLIGVFLIIIFYMVTGLITKYTGLFVLEKSTEETISFKDCLKEKDVTIFINSGKSAETIKELQVFEYLDSIKIFNCLNDNDFCQEKGINSFPSWIVNGEKIPEDISLSSLSKLTKCKL
jgi:hypothetical protein